MKCMDLFALEHSRRAYGIDFALYGAAVLALATVVFAMGPVTSRLQTGGFVLIGLLGWTAVEYALHRFVLHGLQPFQRWHGEHHQRPRALICAPTMLSATLMAALVFLPALVLGNLWRACALTLGLVTGYLGCAVTHHATHHWRADGFWLRQRKQRHVLRHHHAIEPQSYGVTSGLWDHVFRTAQRPTVVAKR